MKFTAFVLVFLIRTFYCNAQDTAARGNKWQFLVEPYIVIPNMSGEAGASVLPNVKVNESPADIFKHVKIGGMLSAEASNDKWAFNADLIYMSLEDNVEKAPVVNYGTLTAYQFAGEVAAFRKFKPWLEAGLGGVITSVKSGFNINVNTSNGPADIKRNISRVWFEPMLVVRTQNKPLAKFVYMVRGEIGGFGIGSDFAWQAQVYAGYRFSKLFQVTAGYRFISIDYERGSGQDHFLYDLNTFGAVIRLGFHF